MDEQTINEEGGVCSLCGGPLSAFGSKKLRDGMLCRDCAAKLSEWITDEELQGFRPAKVKRHLLYREENARRLASFAPTRTVEGKYSLYLDEPGRAFVVSKKKDYVKDNADVMGFSSIRGVRCFRQDCVPGETADVMMEISLFSRQLKKILFRVNGFSGLAPDSEEFKNAEATAAEYLQAFRDAGIKERKIGK